MEKQISTSTHKCGNGFIGEIILQRPASYNALSSEMFRGLLSILGQWEKRRDIFFIILHSSFPKFFCSGGDVKFVGLELMQNRESRKVKDFFQLEYKSDYVIRKCSKPILAWGEGIVMGGGLGIFNGASHKVITRRALLAMPEVGIGFFPDVGSSYFLNKIPNHMGTFLGATGGRFSGIDAKYLGLADYLVEEGQKEKVLSRLYKESWSDIQEEVEKKLDDILTGYRISDPDTGDAEKWQDEVQKRVASGSWEEVAQRLYSWEPPKNSWPEKCLSFLKSGSPLSVALALNYLQKSRNKNYEEIYLDDLNFAYQFCRKNDFVEGVRALLIDKDKSPHWKYQSIEKIPSEELEESFHSIIDREAMKKFFNSDGQESPILHRQEFRS